MTTELNPAELALKFAGIENYRGKAHVPDPETTIDIYFGTDFSGRLIQMPITIGNTFYGEEATLAHAGDQYVTSAMHDPVAVAAIIRTIVCGEDGDASVEYHVRGSGTRPDAQVGEAQIAEATRQRALGTITIDGHPHFYLLRMTNLPHPARPASTDYSTAKLHLSAADSDQEQEVVIAELVLPSPMG